MTIDLDSNICETFGMAQGHPAPQLRRSHRTTHRAGGQRLHNHDIAAACRDKGVRYSITVGQHPRLRNPIKAIPETYWTLPTPDVSSS